MRATWILSLLFASAPPAFGDYQPLTFGELIGTADLIVIGKITKVERSTFQVELQDTFAGRMKPGESITVTQFFDWPCAQRWEKYAVGQRVLLFLQSDEEHPDGPWRILGAGDEGESRVTEDNVRPNFWTGTQTGQKTELKSAKLRAAIVDFRAAYRLTPAKRPWIDVDGKSLPLRFERIEVVPASKAATTPSGFRPRTPPGETPQPRTSEFANRSSLHRFLADWVEEERLKIERYGK